MTEPKRILALSGGGVRGVIEVAFLEAVEAEYQRRYGPETRLCDCFHLIGGTSTGALIATALALGQPLSSVRDFYLDRAAAFFSRRRWWRFGRAPVFDCAGLEAEIRSDIGDITLGDPAFQTYLAIVAKRLDTGSPWILNNIPTAPYYNDPPDGSFIGNRHYDVARLLRAATAAPTLFSQQTLEIVQGEPPGVFIDGGISSYNDPSLALLQLARLKAYGLNWPTGPEALFVLSVGAGRVRKRMNPNAARNASPLRLAFAALTGMVADAEQHSLAMMQWLGTSPSPAWINSEVGALNDNPLGGEALFTFLRLDLPLDRDHLKSAGLDVDDRDLARFRSIDDPSIIRALYELTKDFAFKSLDLKSWLR